VNPLILAIDTTRECGSLALVRGQELIEEIVLNAPGGFAHVIYGHLAQLLDRHGVKPAMVDCFAAASGPGSFTGIRAGIAAAKGLALPRKLPIKGASTGTKPHTSIAAKAIARTNQYFLWSDRLCVSSIEPRKIA